MSFTVTAQTKRFGELETSTLRDALIIKHLFLSKFNIPSCISDDDGFIVSEKEQSDYLLRVL